ncbi:thymidine phosphorylase [candidate division CSSED10-310 bacterium]|uniref:Thymidine phosphorylase n=1 Tax=candidate division CSSED10-310 bacterium TaxID=2855610 RepID=A0ABV6YW15_UNCC1
MLPYEIILKKRNGYPLNRSEIKDFIQGFVRNTIPDYQMSAFLMAVYFKGMTAEETAFLTQEMVNTGGVLHPAPGKITVDKHSTGGVGDKVSIPLIPLLACCGAVVPMISGRGLGHTGGTLDKIESIPGFKTDLSEKEFLAQTDNIGMALAAQTDRLVPADKKMYALRDVTATVDSIPLIIASIMSKKIAEGVAYLILDIKTGRGAFMKEFDQASSLAHKMVRIGSNLGMKVKAVISDMNQPLGFAVGNALEINESLDLLRDQGPPDLVSLTVVLGSHLLLLAGLVQSAAEGEQLLKEKISSGQGLKKFRQLIEAQGGDWTCLNQNGHLKTARHRFSVAASRDGYIASLDPVKIGFATTLLGGGRRKVDDVLDHEVGIMLKAKQGDAVVEGDVLAEIYYNNENCLENALPNIESAIQIVTHSVEKQPLIKKIIEPVS